MKSSITKAQMEMLANNPGMLERLIHSKFPGISREHLTKSLNVLTDITQGRMPQDMQFLMSEGKRVGMSEAETRKVTKEILSHPDPDYRVFAYLTGNGRSMHPQTTRVYREVMEILPLYSQERLGHDLENRLEQNTADDNKWRKVQAESMDAQPIPKGTSQIDRVKAVAADRENMRSLLKHQMGEYSGPETYQMKHDAVRIAQLRLADRIEAGVALNPDADSRTAVRDAYDLHAVNQASIDVGLGDFIEGSKELHEAQDGHYSGDFDVTADLPRN